MLGEYHYLKANFTIQAELLIHLNKQFGVRNLVIEFGWAEVYLYNKYLETEDLYYLNHTSFGFSHFDIFYAALKRLYDYNLGLPTDKKLKVHGHDFEREPGLSASLYDLLSTYPSSPALENLKASIKARLDTIGIQRNVKEYTFFLRDQIAALSLPNDENKQIINNILNNNSFYPNLSARDEYMEKAFVAMDTTNEMYLGQFGWAHTMLNAWNGLAARLERLEKYKEKILVTIFYPVNNERSVDIKDESTCPVFLYRFDSTDEKTAGLRAKGQWALVLKNPPSYPRIE